MDSLSDNDFSDLSFDDIFDGTSFLSDTSSIEASITSSDVIALDGSYELADTVSVSNNVTKKVSAILITDIVNNNTNKYINDLKDDDIAALYYALIFAIGCSGCIKESNTLKFVKHSEKGALEKYNAVKDMVKKVIKMIPTANTILFFSCINFIRFNHHWPSNKRNIQEKALLGISDITRQKILQSTDDRGTESIFYKVFYDLTKAINDYAFYHYHINRVNNLKMARKIYTKGFSQDISYNSDLYTLRMQPTANGLLILDLLKKMIIDFGNLDILPLAPYKDNFKNLLEFLNKVKKTPFSYHPSRKYYKASSENDEKELRNAREIISKIGFLVYSFCQEAGGSLREAKSTHKYSLEKDIKVSNFMKIYTYMTDYELKEVPDFLKETQKYNYKSLSELQEENEKMKKLLNIA